MCLPSRAVVAAVVLLARRRAARAGADTAGAPTGAPAGDVPTLDGQATLPRDEGAPRTDR